MYILNIYLDNTLVDEKWTKEWNGSNTIIEHNTSYIITIPKEYTIKLKEKLPF